MKQLLVSETSWDAASGTTSGSMKQRDGGHLQHFVMAFKL
jgi:hypothetical protein